MLSIHGGNNCSTCIILEHITNKPCSDDGFVNKQSFCHCCSRLQFDFRIGSNQILYKLLFIMEYQIGKLGLAGQSGEHKERQSKNKQTNDSSLHPTDYWSSALSIEIVWLVFRMPNFMHFFPAICLMM